MSEQSTPDVTVVIPSYNSAPWVSSTLGALASAIAESGRIVQVIVVDDGSTDDTQARLDSIDDAFDPPLQRVVQENLGRFHARWAGIQAATARLVLLLDSRVIIHHDALRYVFEEMARHPERQVWNAHVETAEDAPLIGRFWDVPTYIFWGDYLRRPRPYELTTANFDSAPKGTTMFLAPTDVLRDAFEFAWPTGNTKLVSDDTKVLRRVADTAVIRLDPGFAATYRPRTTSRAFVRHSYDRGTLFVDSYAGTSVARSVVLIAITIAPVIVIVALVILFVMGAWAIATGVIAVGLLALLAPIVPAAMNRAPLRSILAYVAGLPLFIAPFWLGLVRGVALHRSSFRGSARTDTLGDPT